MNQQGFEKYTYFAYGRETGTAKSYITAIHILDRLFSIKDVFGLRGKSLTEVDDEFLLHQIAVFVVLVFIVSCALINTDFYNKIKNYSLLQRVFISAKSLVLSSYTVITIAFSVADVLVLFFWGKELNKEKHLFFSLILFTLLCIWHTIDLIRPSNSLHLWLFVITYSII